MDPLLTVDYNDPNPNHMYHQSPLASHPTLSSTPSVAATLQDNNFTVGGNITFHLGAAIPSQQGAVESSTLTLQEIRTLADWLSPLNYHQVQKDVFERVAKGTGSWIFEHKEFDKWLNRETKTLWGVGIPGAGKTCLIAFIINHLVNIKQATVIYVYCQYKDSLTADKILSCLLKQLVEHCNQIASYVWSTLYDKCLHTDTKPSGSELSRTLKGAISENSDIFLVVDALDELKDDVRSDLISKLLSLQLPLLMTSRTHVKVAGIEEPNLTILAPNEDFHTFVSQKLSSMTWLESFLQDPILKNDIIEEICKKCNGMFLLAALQLDTLASGDIINIPTLRQAISKLPTSLNQQYKLILQRILAQCQAQRDLACQAIQLVMHSTRTLQLGELLEALTVDLSTTSINQETCTTPETLLRVSFGLITIVYAQKDTEVQMQAKKDEDWGNREVKLIHYSAQTYLEALHFLPKNSHTFIADLSAVYLLCNSGKCQVTTLTSSSDLEKSEILSMHPFLPYACLNISYHTFKAVEQNMDTLPEQVTQLWQKQLTMPLPLASLGSYLDHVQAVHFAALHGLDFLLQEKWPVSITAQSALGCSPLFYACLGGQTTLVERITGSLAARVGISNPTTFGATVLHAAFRAGKMSIVKVLLPMTSTSTQGRQHLFLGHSKIDVNAKMLNGQTALHLASMHGHAAIIQELFNFLNDRTDASITRSELAYKSLICGYTAAFYVNQNCNTSLLNIQARDKYTAVHYAAQNGHEKAMQILLGCSSVDIELETESGERPLHLAARSGHQAVVQLLLASSSIQVNAPALDGYTPLHSASQNGHHAVAQLLLASPSIQVNAAAQDMRTPLHIAAFNGHKAVVQLLLACSGVQVNAATQDGWTPLHVACQNGHQAAVQLLLASPDIQINATNKTGLTPLHQAAFNGHQATVQLLLASPGIQVNAATQDGWTPLHIAAFNGHKAVVQLLLACPRVQVNAATQDGWTPLHLASQNGHQMAVQLLLASPDIQINATNQTGLTPLHQAAFNGHQAIVQLLLASPSIQVNAPTLDGYTPLHSASQNGHHTVAQLLLASPGIQVNAAAQDVRTPLHIAAFNGHKAVVQLLLACPRVQVNAATQDGWTPLHLAAQNNHHAVAQFLLASPNIQVNASQKDGWTPLHVASQNGHQGAVQLLLASSGIQVNATNQTGLTPLHLAALNSHQAAVQLLLTCPGIQVNAAAQDMRTPLHIAAFNGHKAVVQLLLACSGVQVNAATQDGWTPLHVACQNGHQAAVQLLLASPDIQVNATNQTGLTPLHLAALNSHQAAVQLLLTCPGIQVNAATLDGWTPLHLASQNGHQAVVQLLLACPGIQVNAAHKDGLTPLYLASQNGHQAVVQLLLACPGIQVNAAHKDGFTPLYAASKNGHQAAVQLLLGAPGILVNPEEKYKWTPLHLAARYGHQGVVQLLLAAPGINVKAENHQKSTPFHLAAEYGHPDIVQLLLRSPYDMDINAKDGDGDTAEGCAIKKGHEDIAQLLRSYGGDNSTAGGKDSHAETGSGHEGGAEMGVESCPRIEAAKESDSVAEDVTE